MTTKQETIQLAASIMFSTMEGQGNGIFWWSLPRDYNWEN
jgi:hypothetical protein